jgi:hypothetical protein
MQTLLAIWMWIKANPATCILVMAMVVNFLFAELPKPTNPVFLRLWTILRAFLLVCTTHASEKGTFTWPTVLKLIIDTIAPTKQELAKGDIVDKTRDTDPPPFFPKE